MSVANALARSPFVPIGLTVLIAFLKLPSRVGVSVVSIDLEMSILTPKEARKRICSAQALQRRVHITCTAGEGHSTTSAR